jgi:hypothetical protein
MLQKWVSNAKIQCRLQTLALYVCVYNGQQPYLVVQRRTSSFLYNETSFLPAISIIKMEPFQIK